MSDEEKVDGQEEQPKKKRGRPKGSGKKTVKEAKEKPQDEEQSKEETEEETKGETDEAKDDSPFSPQFSADFIEAPLTAALVPFQEVPKPERAKALREGIVACFNAGDKLQMVAAELLYEVHKNELWKEYSYTAKDGAERQYGSFKDYVEKEVPFESRKAYYLIDIYKKFVIDLQIPMDILRDAEWSKLAQISSVVTTKNWKKLLDVLPDMSVKEVIEMVQGVKGKSEKTTKKAEKSDDEADAPDSKPSGPKEPTGEDLYDVRFKVYEAQRENIESALKVAEFETQSDKPGHLLDVICTDYLAGRAMNEPVDGTDAEKKEAGLDALCGRLDGHLQRLERTFGVKLEVVGTTASMVAETDDGSSTTVESEPEEEEASDESDVAE